MPRVQTLFAALAVVLGASFVASAAPLPYQLNVVAQTGEGRFALLNTPSLNNLSVAAFRGNDAAGNGGVFYGTPGTVQQLPTPGLTITPLGGPFAFGDLVGVNDSGRLAFTALPPNPNGFEGNQGVYSTIPGGPLQTVLGAFTVDGDIRRGPAINQSGTVIVSAGSTVSGVYVGDGTMPAAQTFRAAAEITPRINDGGHVALTTLPAGFGRALYFDYHVIVTSNSPVPGIGELIPYEADLANDNRVLFSANHDGLDTSLFLWADGSITRAFESDSIETPALNNRGDIATLNQAAFGRPERLSLIVDGAEDPVVSVGDALLGSTVTDLAFVAEGFNDAGQLAFLAQLADGREAVVIATPLPEPAGASIALAALGLTTLTRRRRSHRP